MSATRRPLKFESASGSISYSWPRYNLEYDYTQPLLASSVPLTGAHYEYDQLEGAPSIKGVGTHTVRFLMVGTPSALETELDEMKSKLYSIGRGKFFLEDSDGAQRWCWARMTSMPDIRLGVTNRETIPVIISWRQFSDFYDAEPIGDHDEGVFTISSDPDTIVVTNPGSADVRNMVITVKDPTAQPFKLTNTTTGYVIEHNNFSGWYRFDTGRNTVERSGDSGATWDDDSTWFVRQDGQVGMMLLAPGANSIIVDNVNSGDVIFDFYGAYA